MRCSSWSLGPSPLPPTVSCLAAERRGDCVHASRLYSFSNASIATRTSVCTSYCCGSNRFCSLIVLLGSRPKQFFDMRSDRPSRQILAQNLTTWATSDSHIRYYPVGFRIYKKTDPICRSKRKNLLTLGLHKNQLYFDVTTWQYRVDVVPDLPKRPGSVRYRYRCCTDTGTNFGADVHTGTGGTGIDVVPNIPKYPVPVFISYRTCRSVRYRY